MGIFGGSRGSSSCGAASTSSSRALLSLYRGSSLASRILAQSWRHSSGRFSAEIVRKESRSIAGGLPSTNLAAILRTMSDWDNWQPARPAAVIGSAAHRARAALSPASSGGPPAGPARGGGWQQHPGTAAGGHADRGWGNKAAAGAPAVASTSQLPPINSRREDAATVAKRAADARMREKLQQEQSSSNSDRTHRERSRERYSASASSGRERYSASDRERERERPRDRDSRSDGKRRRSRSRGSRSPPRERERERERHRRDRTDEGRDVRQRRDKSEERRSRGHSPRAKVSYCCWLALPTLPY